jgi:hypothetical protein
LHNNYAKVFLILSVAGETMNHYLLLFLVSILAMSTCSAEQFNIILKSKWCNLDNNCANETEFGGKWILVGSITFKKRCKDPIYMDTITLHWNGDNIDHLIASLYKKNRDKELFLPIEENVICDGIWNPTKQNLILHFDEKENLAPTTIFYLVLTVPEELETILKNGSFSLEEHCLPKPFKQCVQQEKLSLAINKPSSKQKLIPTTH